MFKKQLLLILFIFWVQESSCFISELYEIVKTLWKFGKHLNDIKSSGDTVKAIKEYITKEDDFTEIVQKLDVINHKLDNLKDTTEAQLSYITLLIEQLPAELDIHAQGKELDKFVRATDAKWKTLISYIELGATEKMFHDFAEEILKELKSPLVEFRNTLNSPRNGIFRLIVDNAEKKRDILCGEGETSHHKILFLFRDAMSTEIKAHTLLFSAQFIRYSQNDAWKIPLEKDFVEQFNRSVDAFTNALNMTMLPYIRSCDPKPWQLDINCYGLYEYLQQTIYIDVSEISPDAFARQKISTTILGVSSFEDQPLLPFTKHTECEKRPSGCARIKIAVKEIFACVWETGPYKVRYVKYIEGPFGTDNEAMALLKEKNEMSCSSGNSYYRPALFHPRKDAIYRCQCPESRMKLLRQMMDSNWHENYVIVGLRIQKIHDYMYIQIAEGKFEANGYISNYSWIPLTRAIESSWPEPLVLDSVKKNEDAFFLGDVQLPPGYALTSIGFVQREMNGVNGTAVKIGGLEIDYGTGEVLTSRKVEFLLEHGTHRELTFPTKTPINKSTSTGTTPKSDGYTHLHLQPSDLNDDYGQTTLPLLDASSLLTGPLAPIGGVGFFYRASAEEYAGFLSLRLYPLNYTYFIDSLKKQVIYI